MVWALIITVGALLCVGLLWAWFRGHTIQDLVENPPAEVDLPEIVTILSYLHHELIKHRLPLVRSVADRPLAEVQPEDVEILKQAVTGQAERPSVTAELEGYLAGLRRASGAVPLNFWRDPLVRRARRACRMIQAVGDGLGSRNRLTSSEHRRLRRADKELDAWFRPRLQALRNSVLMLSLTEQSFREPVRRARQELAAHEAEVVLPALSEPLQVKMLRPDFDLVLRNLVRNGLRAAMTAGSARVAIELTTRLELTGDEAVLLRIHDTNPTMLSREQLYGGQLGRGLHIVTTTLRRYDGSIACRKSSLPGFAKFLEVRLTRVLAEDTGRELLQESDPLTRLVPVAASLALAAATLVAGAGWMGLLPDPLAGASVEVTPDAGVEADAGPADNGAALAVVIVARDAASQQVAHKVALAQRKAFSNLKGLAELRVPSPADIEVDPRRCLEPSRFSDERHFSADCRLISASTFQLESPVLLIRAARGFDLSRLILKVEEKVEDGGAVETAHERCMVVGAIPPYTRVRGPLATWIDKGDKEPSAYARLAINYADCLQQLRYPLRIRITLSRPLDDDTNDPRDPNLHPVQIDLTIRMRNEDARDAYAKIANNGAIVPDDETRAELVKVIARHVARKLEYSFSAGAMPESSQQDLASALYFGFVRPGFHHAIRQRVALASIDGPPPSSFCDLYEEISGGYGRLRELNPVIAQGALHRAAYYTHQARAWVLGDIPGATDQLIAFQDQNSRYTDFVQGARFYAALLLTLDAPPQAGGGAGALGGQGGARDPVVRTAMLLRRLLDDIDRPSPRGSDLAYDKVKLLGAHILAEDESDFYLGAPVTVKDALCGFYEARSAWVEAMSTTDVARLFGHCARYLPPPGPDGLLGDDRDPPDAGADAPDATPTPRPLPIMSEDVQRTMVYIQQFQAMMRKPWTCDGARPPGTAAPAKDDSAKGEEKQPVRKEP